MENYYHGESNGNKVENEMETRIIYGSIGVIWG